jgi:alkylation response protein AidB-like acyl-CoA dehydrogenase
MREMPVQKYVRDALVLLHMDGTNQVSRIRLGGLIERRGAVQVPQLV